MGYFGRKYDAPVYEAAARCATPVGELCIWCEVPFVPGSDGFRYVSGEYAHRSCFLEQVLGRGMAQAVLNGDAELGALCREEGWGPP